jgi:hypothetical protein
MLHLIVGFGVLMGWAHVMFLSFISCSSLRTKMLPTITKRNVFGTFLDNLGLEDPVVIWFVICRLDGYYPNL